jgi:hypothetical protein
MLRRTLLGRSLMDRRIGERPQQSSQAQTGAGEEQTADAVLWSDGSEVEFSNGDYMEFS